MLRSLRARLLLSIMGVAAVSLALAAWLFSRVTVVKFEEFQAAERHEQRELAVAGIAAPLQAFHETNGSWAGVEELLARAQKETGLRLILMGVDGNVAGVSTDEFRNARITTDASRGLQIEAADRGLKLRLTGANPVALRSKSGEIGLLYTLPQGPRGAGDGEEIVTKATEARNFPLAVNRSLAGVMALVLGLAGGVAFWLARRIVGPVEALTGAVEKMREGDLHQRVPAGGRDEIGELGRAFNAMAEKLARVEQLRRDMVSDVAHELRTPLTNMRAQIEAIQDGLSEPRPEVIASLHEEALHLGRLVDDLRDLSLADAGQLRIELQPLAPACAIGQAIDAVQARARDREISIERNYNGALPEICADPVRFGQILRNLLDNAVRHTPPGGHIAVDARTGRACVDFTVRDNGPGIAPEHLANIFERFYRTDASRARQTGGAGLGLAIVKQLVIAHGGTVRAESTPGSGAAIHFSIPTQRVSEKS